MLTVIYVYLIDNLLKKISRSDEKVLWSTPHHYMIGEDWVFARRQAVSAYMQHLVHMILMSRGVCPFWKNGAKFPPEKIWWPLLVKTAFAEKYPIYQFKIVPPPIFKGTLRTLRKHLCQFARMTVPVYNWPSMFTQINSLFPFFKLRYGFVLAKPTS